MGARVCLPDKKVYGLLGSLGSYDVGGGPAAPEGDDAVMRDLFSPMMSLEVRDLQAIALLVNLSESGTINRTTRAALLYAAERLWGLLEEAVDIADDGDEPDGPEGDDGPLSLGAPDEDGPLEPSLSSLGPSSIPSPSPGTLPDRMFPDRIFR